MYRIPMLWYEDKKLEGYNIFRNRVGMWSNRYETDGEKSEDLDLDLDLDCVVNYLFSRLLMHN